MASTAAYDELDRVRKALKHARIKRGRAPKVDADAKRRAEEEADAEPLREGAARAARRA